MNKTVISRAEIHQIGLSILTRTLFFKEFILFSTSSVIYQGSRFLVSLVAAKLLGPTTFGLWNILNLIIIYSCVIHLGTVNAMNRDVPLFKGKGDFQKVDEIRQETLGFMSLSTLLASAAIAIGSFFIKDSTLRTSLQFMALLLLFTQIYNYLQVYLKSDKRFNKQSCQQFAFAIILPVVVIPFIMTYRLPGFILGQSMSIFVVSLFIMKLVPFDLKPKLNAQETIRLIKVGFPIMVVGLLHVLLTTADRWIIMRFLGIEQLGYYSLAIMAMGFLGLVPMVISQQVYPRMAETFGRTASYSALKKWILSQVIIALGITVPLVFVVYFIFPPVVGRFLPSYVPGITAMEIMLIGLIFLPLAGGFGNFLNTVDKQVYYMAVQGLAVLVNLGLNISFVKMGLGINGVALGTAITYVIFSLTLALVTKKIMRKSVSEDRAI